MIGGIGREVTVTCAGRSYVIPEIWLVGFTTANHCPVADAVAWWIHQDELERSAGVDGAGRDGH